MCMCASVDTKRVFPCCVCVCVPGGGGGGDGASSQGHLVDVIVARAVQVGQGEVWTGRCGHRG